MQAGMERASNMKVMKVLYPIIVDHVHLVRRKELNVNVNVVVWATRGDVKTPD